MVKSFLSILSTRQNNILSGATILMVAVFGSRFLGLIRNRLLLHNFDTATTDIFFGANKVPELLFNLLIFGAFTVAFIPIFSEYLNHKKESEAFEFASNILNLALVAFALAVLIAIIFTPFLNSFFVPGFTGEKKVLTDELTRIILGAQIILVVGTFLMAVSQSYQRFIISALAPLFYNIGIIFGIAVLTPFFGIYAPAYGIVIGALLHVLIQIPLVRALGFQYKITFDIFNKGVRDIFKLMSIRNIGLVAEQVSDTVGIALASLLANSSVTVLTLSTQLQAVPIGLFGATIAQAALPVLSREQSKGEGESFKITLLTTMHQILFLTLPAAAMLIVLRIPIVRLVFGASQFNWDDTVLTGRTAAFLALGLAATSVSLLLVRGFYALKDTKTPVLVSIITVALNIFLSVLFVMVYHFEIWSLGLSYSVSQIISVLLLLYFLGKKVGGFENDSLFNPALKMILASLVAAIALYIPIKALDQLVFDTTRTVNLIILTGIASTFGLSIYILLVWLLRVQELTTYVNLIKRVSKLTFPAKTEGIVEETTGV